MTDNVLHEDTPRRERHSVSRVLPWLVGALLVILLAVLWISAPPGILGKAHMLGYAVCHQIESHSFVLGGRALPLCARCTGTFIGAMVGLFGQAVILRRHRAAGFPPAVILAVLISFTFLWAADGVNSYLALVGGPHAYEPLNALRLATGALNGLTMSALILPVLNISIWRQPLDAPAIQGGRDILLLVLLEMAFVGVVLSGADWLLYPLSVLGGAAVLVLLGSVNTVLAVVVVGRENTIETWRQALLPLAVGLLLALVQVSAIDLVRYRLTGTLEGLPIGF